MNVPPPPAWDRRFLQFLSQEGQAAVQAGSGPVFELLLQAVQEANPDCFANDAEASAFLRCYIWPPTKADMIFEDFPHLPVFPTHLKVAGRVVEVLVCHPVQYVKELGHRTAIMVAFSESVGGVEGMKILHQQASADGYSNTEFDRMIAAMFADAERRAQKSVQALVEVLAVTELRR